MANLCKDVGLLGKAAALYEIAIELRPDLAEAHGNLASVLKNLGQFDKALASFQEAIRLKPDDDISHSGLIFTLNYLPNIAPKDILTAHIAWAKRHADPLKPKSPLHANVPEPDRRLRIGYVSADFRRHPIGQFILPLLENHDHQRSEIFCYSNVQFPDAITERMQKSCDAWRDISPLADDPAAKLIQSDAIDILIDLSGHTAGNRLKFFAQKPAPIQVTYLGYPNTTGLSAIDYRLTDSIADPADQTDALNVEKLWRLPTCAWCYQPLERPPEIRPRPDGPITFGCFNAFAKINPPLLNLWADLLNRVPGSRIILKSAGTGVNTVRSNLLQHFARRNIPADRVELLGNIPDPHQHLDLYNRIDIALDTFPYHSTTTTCEALHMGVPVVTLAGNTHVSRVGVSLLTNVGLAEMITQSPEEYITISINLANDPSRLRDQRQTLRPRMEAFPLMNAPRFARDVESAFRQMWQTWCAAKNSRL
jgi:predicted O-linked N-acetylglucosamine transferase (SPINDLY family)